MPEKDSHSDPLEQFFQKKAGEFDIPYREENWLKLENMLIAKDAHHMYRRRLQWIAAASILIISLLGYFTYDNHSRLNEMTALVESKPPEIDERTQPADPEPDFSAEGYSNQIESEENTRNDRDDSQAGSQMSEPAANDPVSTNAPESSETIVHTHENGRIGADLTHDPIPADAFSVGMAALSERAGENAFEPFVKINESDASALAEQSAIHHADSDLLPNQSGRFATRSRFSVSISASPDQSSAGSFSRAYDTGYKIGMAGEYRLTHNLSISAGMMLTDIRYVASGTQYNPPGYRSIHPDETEAVCLILDIPLTVKYNVIRFANSRIYTTAGLSSYIMLHEKYRFSYTNGMDDLPGELNIRNGSRHWLNSAGFSAGFEVDIHPSVSLRAEPFVKIPIKEVGWGNVNLYSMGAYITLNYHFPKW